MNGPTSIMFLVATSEGLRARRMDVPAVKCADCDGEGCGSCHGLGAWACLMLGGMAPVPPDDAVVEEPCAVGAALRRRIRRWKGRPMGRRLGLQWRDHFLSCRQCYVIWAAEAIQAGSEGES